MQKLLLMFIEWVASKGAAIVWQEIQEAIAKHKADEQLKKNQEALQKAIESGKEDAVKNAGSDSLNNRAP